MNAQAFALEVFYDGDCPLCRREIALLQRLDRRRGALRYVDIADPDFQALSYGRSRASLMARMHARLPDGTWVEGMEVFRRAYAAVGLGWLLAPTRWPILRQLADWAYRVFARNRLRLFGRGDACDRACQPAPPASVTRDSGRTGEES